MTWWYYVWQCYFAFLSQVRLCMNFPGSRYDSHVSIGLINMVLEYFSRFNICVDQGSRHQEICSISLLVCQKVQEKIWHWTWDEIILRQYNMCVLQRQSITLQGKFSRLKSILPSIKLQRKFTIGCCIISELIILDWIR